MHTKDEFTLRFEEELVEQFDSDLAAIELASRPLTPAEADGLFGALTAMAVGSYNLVGAALEVARGGGHRLPPLVEAPDEVTVHGLRQAFDELKATRDAQGFQPVQQRKQSAGRAAL